MAERSKYIKAIDNEGNFIPNIELICNDWCDNFYVYTDVNWCNEQKREYRFEAKTKNGKKYLCSFDITYEQAMEIVKKLGLVLVKSELRANFGIYRKKSFVQKEIENLEKLKEEKRKEIRLIDAIIEKNKEALNS